MIYITLIILVVLYTQIVAAQQPSTVVNMPIREQIIKDNIKTYESKDIITFDTIPQMHYDKYFFDAYDELSDMLEEREPYNLKRAEFLVEWAYYSGMMDYDAFCDSISHAVDALNRFIRIMNIQHYKTAANAALFSYFTKPSWMNGYIAFSYDVEDCSGEKDISKLFVSKVIRTHTGQCSSLPIYYKILCNELGGKAYLATAPRHMYVKHIGEDGRWVNVELTTGSFARDEWYIQSAGVSTEAIKNGVFLTAMSEKEDIAYMIYMLGIAYQKKYVDYDYFTLMCANRILNTLPRNYHALNLSIATRNQWGYDYVHIIGKVPSYFIFKNNQEYLAAKEILKFIGYTEFTEEEYIKNVEKSYNDMVKDIPSSCNKFNVKKKNNM